MIHFHFVVENKSRYAIERVWENAQDLEHVGFLHANTNKSFTLLHTEKYPGSSREYDVMVYRSVRRFFFWGMQSVGFRRVVADNHIHQVEYIPLLGVTSALNSLLYSTGDQEFPTLMRDEIVMEVPRWMKPLKNYFGRALRRHTRIQCAEDEPFRQRRAELASRGINLPYRIFFEPKYQELKQKFVHRPNQEEPSHGSLRDERRGNHFSQQSAQVSAHRTTAG